MYSWHFTKICSHRHVAILLSQVVAADSVQMTETLATFRADLQPRPRYSTISTRKFHLPKQVASYVTKVWLPRD